jgi:hypothetical protein
LTEQIEEKNVYADLLWGRDETEPVKQVSDEMETKQNESRWVEWKSKGERAVLPVMKTIAEMEGKPDLDAPISVAERLGRALSVLLNAGIEADDETLQEFDIARVAAVLLLLWLLTDREADQHPIGRAWGPWGNSLIDKHEIKGRGWARFCFFDAHDDSRQKLFRLARQAADAFGLELGESMPMKPTPAPMQSERPDNQHPSKIATEAHTVPELKVLNTKGTVTSMPIESVAPALTSALARAALKRSQKRFEELAIRYPSVTALEITVIRPPAPSVIEGLLGPTGPVGPQLCYSGTGIHDTFRHLHLFGENRAVRDLLLSAAAEAWSGALGIGFGPAAALNPGLPSHQTGNGFLWFHLLFELLWSRQLPGVPPVAKTVTTLVDDTNVHVDIEDLASPDGRPFSPVYARAVKQMPSPPGWFYSSFSDVAGVSAHAIDCILARIAGAASADVDQGEPSSDSDDPTLSEPEWAIIRKLGKSQILLKGPDAYAGIGERTGKLALMRLEQLNIVERPRGPRQGYALTELGTRISKRPPRSVLNEPLRT